MINNIRDIKSLIEMLEDAKLHFSLHRYLIDSVISIHVSPPHQRWEIDILDDGEVYVEIFTSDGNIYDENKLFKLIGEAKKELDES